MFSRPPFYLIGLTDLYQALARDQVSKIDKLTQFISSIILSDAGAKADETCLCETAQTPHRPHIPSSCLARGPIVCGAIDGDSSFSERERVRNRDIILSNPDLLHFSILPQVYSMQHL